MDKYFNKKSRTLYYEWRYTGYFKLERGAREGDTITAYLFTIVLEVYFHMIRKNSEIKGIKVFDYIFQIAAC